MSFIEDMRAEGHAVESTCRVLTEHGCSVAARTYRTWRQANRPVAARTVSDAVVIDALLATRGTPEGLYGRRKMTAHLRRQGLVVAQCTIDRPCPVGEDAGHDDRRHAVLHVVKTVQQVAGHQEVDAARGQQRPVVHLRPALQQGHVQSVFLVGAVGDRLVEAAMRGLRFPVGGKANLVVGVRSGRRQRGQRHHKPRQGLNGNAKGGRHRVFSGCCSDACQRASNRRDSAFDAA